MIRVLFVLLLSISSAQAMDFSPAKPLPAVTLGSDQLVNRIAFGSCFDQALKDDVFDTVTSTAADAFMFIGDNVYAEDESDDPNLQSLKNAYGLLAESDAFERLRNSMPLLVTWDDHDYGINDGGANWPQREASEALYEYVWVPKADQRRHQPGIYYERTVGPEGRRVQLILLDTRFFRSNIERSKTPVPNGRYQQHMGNNEMLGEQQWQWLESKLKQPADIRIIASSLQMIATGHAWEAWHVMPDERTRFFNLLTDIKPNGVVLISGDRHSAAIYRQADRVPYPLWEVTSSSLNKPLSAMIRNIKTEPGQYRQGQPFYDANFGIIDIDWANQNLLLQVRDDEDRVVRAATIKFSELEAGKE